MRAWRVLVLAASLCCAFPALAKETPVAVIAETLQAADSYSYVLSAGDESVKVRTAPEGTFSTVLEGEGGALRKAKDGAWEASPHLSARIAPFVLQRAFGPLKLSDMRLDVKAGGKAHILYAVGTAEAVYALRLLGPAGAFTQWLDAHAPLDASLEDLSKAGDLQGATKEIKQAKDLLAPAKQAYAAKRPALMRRFNTSYLYYGAANDMAWSARESKDGSARYAVASAGDLMYAAQFWFRFKKSPDGKWMNDKVFGQEVFKGE